MQCGARIARLRLLLEDRHKGVSMGLVSQCKAGEGDDMLLLVLPPGLLRGVRRRRRATVQATKLPIDEPLQVEAAGGGMIGKSNAARTMAWHAQDASAIACACDAHRTGEQAGRG